VPCVGYGPGACGWAMAAAFYDRTLAALDPRPVTVGVGYANGYVPWLQPEPHDVPLDAMLTDEGLHWQRAGAVPRRPPEGGLGSSSGDDQKR
jgi:5-formyltetrahydrofolate cyclo-ligase